MRWRWPRKTVPTDLERVRLRQPPGVEYGEGYYRDTAFIQEKQQSIGRLAVVVQV
jgi:hypothetical protein